MSFTNYTFRDPIIFQAPAEQVDKYPLYPLGQTAIVDDSTYGMAELIYLQCGARSEETGACLIYGGGYQADLTYYQVSSGSGAGGSIAVALADRTANQYGWCLKRGVMPVLAEDIDSSGVAIYSSSTRGEVTSIALDGQLIYKARSYSAVGTPTGSYALGFFDDCFVLESI